MAWSNPAAAVDLILSKPGLAGISSGEEIGRALGEDPAAAEAALARVPPGRFRTALINGVASELASDPETAVAWTESLLPGEREAALQGIFYLVGQTDPEAGFRLAVTKLDGAARETALSQMMESWARLDFDAAFTAATQSLDAGLVKKTLPNLYMGSAFFLSSDPEGGIGRLSDLDESVRADALRAVGEQLGRSSMSASTDLLSALDPSDRADFAEGLIAGAYRNPELTIELAALLPVDRQLDRVRKISEAIAYGNPRGAAEFVLSLPDREGDTRKREALGSVVGEWVYEDPAAAEAFVRGLPAGPAKDAAARKLAGGLREFDLDAAARALGEISGAEARSAVIGELAREWARVDPQRGRVILEPLLRTAGERERAKALREGR
jgi:hypothetical protein